MVKIREVPGFPGYAASEDGSIWSKMVRGKSRIGREWRELKPQKGNKGHMHVTLCRDGEKSLLFVHHVVLLVFVGPRPEGQETRHLNGDPADNRLENICYGTQLENRHDTIRHGTSPQGETHGRHKLTEEQVREIIRLRAEEGVRDCKLAEMYGVTPGAIHYILQGKTWKHIERPETFVPRQRDIKTQSAKITEDDVREIRKLFGEGWLQESLAEEFGISAGAVSHIITGRSWSHVV